MACQVGTEGKVRDGKDDREGRIHDGEAGAGAEAEGKVRDEEVHDEGVHDEEEDQEGTVHGVDVESCSANLQERAHPHHPLVGERSR